MVRDRASRLLWGDGASSAWPGPPATASTGVTSAPGPRCSPCTGVGLAATLPRLLCSGPVGGRRQAPRARVRGCSSSTGAPGPASAPPGRQGRTRGLTRARLCPSTRSTVGGGVHVTVAGCRGTWPWGKDMWVLQASPWARSRFWGGRKARPGAVAQLGCPLERALQMY